MKDGFLQFGVYDYDFIGKNDFHGEAFLPLDSIELQETLPTGQINLHLDKPTNETNKILTVLEARSWDKSATKFVKIEYSKTDSS